MENVKESEMEVAYCIHHAEEVEIFTEDDGFPYHFHMIAEDDGYRCYGEFATCPPPPSLTEEDWATIFEQEVYL